MKSAKADNAFIALMCSESAIMVKSGIDIAEGFLLLSDSETKYKATLKLIADRLFKGESLSTALEKSAVFPTHFIKMIAIGEKTGRLEETLFAMSSYYLDKDSLTGAMRDTIRYPSVMLSVFVAVAGVIFAYVLPVFAQVYTQIGAEMNYFMKAFLQLGLFIRSNIIIFALLVGVIALAANLLYGKNKGVSKLSLSAKVSGIYEAADFASALSMCLKSGLDTNEGVKSACELCESKIFKDKTDSLCAMLDAGEAFDEAVIKSGVFSPIYSGIIKAGAKTGLMDQAVENVAAGYSRAARKEAEKMVASSEPTVIIAVSLVVGFLLVSVMLPLIELISSI